MSAVWSFLCALTKWLWQMAVITASLSATMFAAALVMAFVLPAGGNGGVDSGFELSHFILAVSLTYYLTTLPFASLPLDSGRMYPWFLFVECGWVACLCGAVLSVLIQPWDYPVSYSTTVAGLITAAVFIVPMIVVLCVQDRGPRRFAAVASLFVAWVAVETGGFLALTWGDFAGMKLLMPLIGLLLAPLLVSGILPRQPFNRRDFTLFSFFVWAFVVTCAAAWLTLSGELLLDPQSDKVMFRWLCVTPAVGALANVIGLPIGRHRFLGAITGFLAFAVAGYVTLVMTPWGGESIIDHVWSSYTGPRLAL